MLGTGAAAADETVARGTMVQRPSRPRIRQRRTAAPRQAPVVTSGLLAGTSTSSLLASLVHELRTPVSALATGSELLLDDLDQLSRDDLQRIVETMHRGAVWLQRLVENVLYAATVAEGEVQLYPRPLDLIELIRDVVPVVDPLLRQRRQQLRIVDRLDGALIAADSRRIGQVLINLIANASKYSGPSTRIEVAAARRGERVRLHVADRGPGLPAGEADDLFAAYTRAPEAGLAGIDGAGLGLAIVKSIVDLHGGTVGATRRRGGGSIFWVELPLTTRDVAAPTAASTLARRRLA
jgi:two-component system sensor histidine kinase KdpD